MIEIALVVLVFGIGGGLALLLNWRDARRRKAVLRKEAELLELRCAAIEAATRRNEEIADDMGRARAALEQRAERVLGEAGGEG